MPHTNIAQRAKKVVLVHGAFVDGSGGKRLTAHRSIRAIRLLSFCAGN
jgi:hypothetical protein